MEAEGLRLGLWLGLWLGLTDGLTDGLWLGLIEGLWLGLADGPSIFNVQSNSPLVPLLGTKAPEVLFHKRKAYSCPAWAPAGSKAHCVSVHKSLPMLIVLESGNRLSPTFSRPGSPVSQAIAAGTVHRLVVDVT
jgi:hypothetical protein